MNRLTTPVITALVCSARRRGNAYNLADYCLDGLRSGEYRRVRLLNFYDYDVQACQHCAYECLAEQPGCPRKDDVAWLWEYTWRSDAVIWAIPTYGGLPPAIWTAFAQRLQYLGQRAPERRIPLAVICIADPDGSTAAESTPELLRRQADARYWDLIDLAVFGAQAHGSNSVRAELISVPGVQRRLDEMVEAIIKVLPEA